MNRTLTIILTLHFFLVFLLSSSMISLPSDMIESLLWGRTLDFSSDKHPPFYSWVHFLAVKAFGGNLVATHILTPLSQVIMLLFVFLLGEKIFKSKEKALLGVVLCQGIIVHVFYYLFNANTANFAFFGAIYFIFYKIVKQRKYILLPLLGFLCGVILLIKYSGIILIFLLGLTILLTKEGRRVLGSFYFFIAIFVFCLVLTPYVLSLFSDPHNETIIYLLHQSIGSEARFYEVPRLLFMPIVYSIPLLIAFFFIKKKNAFIKREFNFTSTFLVLNVFGPIVISLLYILFKKAQIGALWLSMFYILFPIALLYFFEVKDGALKVAMKIVYSIMLTIYCFYLIVLLFSPEDDTKAISQFYKEVEEQNFHGEKVNDFICNAHRRMCGTVVLYSTDYEKIHMPLTRFANPFSIFDLENKQAGKRPEKLIVIGDSFPISLPGYNLTYYERSFPVYYKFKFLYKVIPKLPEPFKKRMERYGEPVRIVLITANLKKDENLKAKP